MRYEENNFSSDRKKFSTGLVIAIGCALLIVAGAAWFALRGTNSGDTVPETVSEIESDMGSMYSEITSDVESKKDEIASDFDSFTSRVESEYGDMTSSYNDNASHPHSSLPTTSAEPTGEGVSSVPYKVFSMPVEGEILKKFSATELQYSKTFGDMRLHSGIDIACKKGTAVSACADGKVLTIDDNGQFGMTITIDHFNGITARYSALENITLKEGDKIKAGDIIGEVTTIPSECNDPEHLHFEVYKNGVAVSPLEALGLE